MSKIICEAYFSMGKEQSACPITVSSSFQAALTPWMLTLAPQGKSYDDPDADEEHYMRVGELKAFALSPTFQFTRSLTVFWKQIKEQHELTAEAGLCAPLFSHLQELSLLVFGHDPNICAPDELADFALKFRRLEKFSVSSTSHPYFSHPFAVVNIYTRMFRSHQSISDTLLVSIVQSLDRNIHELFSWSTTFHEENAKMENHIKRVRQKMLAEILERHKMRAFLVNKMVKTHERDHGKSVCVFLSAICHILEGLRQHRPNVDSVPTTADSLLKDLAPAFDLIETITLNGDLLHPSFRPISTPLLMSSKDQNDNDAAQKWCLPLLMGELLASYFELIQNSRKKARSEFMCTFGRAVLPSFFKTVFSEFDETAQGCRAILFILQLSPYVLSDELWIDGMETTMSDDEDSGDDDNDDDDDEDDNEDENRLIKLQKFHHDARWFAAVVNSGRKLLQHIPFDQISFVIKQVFNNHRHLIGTAHPAMLNFFKCLSSYCKSVARVSAECDAAVEKDVIARLNEQKLLPFLFEWSVSKFEEIVWTNLGEDEGVPLLKSNFRCMTLMLHSYNNNDNDADDDNDDDNDGTRKRNNNNKNSLSFVASLRAAFFDYCHSSALINTMMRPMRETLCKRFKENVKIRTRAVQWFANIPSDDTSYWDPVEKVVKHHERPEVPGSEEKAKERDDAEEKIHRLCHLFDQFHGLRTSARDHLESFSKQENGDGGHIKPTAYASNMVKALDFVSERMAARQDEFNNSY